MSSQSRNAETGRVREGVPVDPHVRAHAVGYTEHPPSPSLSSLPPARPPQHLISRPAQLSPCRRCGHSVFAAIAGGLGVTADLQPLTTETEIAAILTGRQTYDIQVTVDGRMYLEWRHIDRIRDTRRFPVVATHICKPPVVPQPAMDLTPPRVPLPDVPPF